MGADRLDWIFDGESSSSLEDRYDAWAASYDADHDEWGWRGPGLVAAATLRHLGRSRRDDTIIDAGCGTGKAGIALRNVGWTGRIVGLDFSQGMLDQAATFGVYDELIKCSLYDIELPDAVACAVVSSGVFTHGHVGGEALGELCRVTSPDGFVTLTRRVDLADFAQHVEALRVDGRWEEIERSEPERLHPDHNDTEQFVVTWQVRRPER
ncbi:MAG: class I SAM-dependent methyltransferase [Ilumatobacter sp.]